MVLTHPWISSGVSSVSRRDNSVVKLKPLVTRNFLMILHTKYECTQSHTHTVTHTQSHMYTQSHTHTVTHVHINCKPSFLEIFEIVLREIVASTPSIERGEHLLNCVSNGIHLAEKRSEHTVNLT